MDTSEKQKQLAKQLLHTAAELAAVALEASLPRDIVLPEGTVEARVLDITGGTPRIVLVYRVRGRELVFASFDMTLVPDTIN